MTRRPFSLFRQTHLSFRALVITSVATLSLIAPSKAMECNEENRLPQAGAAPQTSANTQGRATHKPRKVIDTSSYGDPTHPIKQRWLEEAIRKHEENLDVTGPYSVNWDMVLNDPLNDTRSIHDIIPNDISDEAFEALEQRLINFANEELEIPPRGIENLIGTIQALFHIGKHDSCFQGADPESQKARFRKYVHYLFCEEDPSFVLKSLDGINIMPGFQKKKKYLRGVSFYDYTRIFNFLSDAFKEKDRSTIKKKVSHVLSSARHDMLSQIRFTLFEWFRTQEERKAEDDRKVPQNDDSSFPCCLDITFSKLMPFSVQPAALQEVGTRWEDFPSFHIDTKEKFNSVLTGMNQEEDGERFEIFGFLNEYTPQLIVQVFTTKMIESSYLLGIPRNRSDFVEAVQTMAPWSKMTKAELRKLGGPIFTRDGRRIKEDFAYEYLYKLGYLIRN